MGVHRKRGHAEGLGHDDGGGLVTDAGQRLKRGEIRGHFAAVLLDEDFREAGNGGGLARRQAAGADDGADFVDRDVHHVAGIVGQGEEGGCDQVHADVGALGGEQDGDEQGERVRVIQWDRRLGIEFRETAQEMVGALLLEHGGVFRRAGADGHCILGWCAGTLGLWCRPPRGNYGDQRTRTCTGLREGGG